VCDEIGCLFWTKKEKKACRGRRSVIESDNNKKTHTYSLCDATPGLQSKKTKSTQSCLSLCLYFFQFVRLSSGHLDFLERKWCKCQKVRMVGGCGGWRGWEDWCWVCTPSPRILKRISSKSSSSGDLQNFRSHALKALCEPALALPKMLSNISSAISRGKNRAC
jgi:hypothetical protein